MHGKRRLGPEVGGKRGAHLGDLRHRNGEAVSLSGILGKEVLMVVLGSPEVAERFNCRDQAAIPDALGTRARGFEEQPLLITYIEHGTAILRADIIALSIQLTRIMHGKKCIQNNIRRNDRFIKVNPHDLGVPRCSATDLLVCRGINGTTAIPGDNVGYARKNPVCGIEAPKAPAAQYETHHDTYESTALKCQNVVMNAMTSFTRWLTDTGNLGSVVGIAIIVGALLIAIVLGAVLGGIARKRRKEAIENELNTLAPIVMNVAIDASMYANLAPEAKQLADRAAIGIDMRIRLLNRDGATEAADWLSIKFTALRNASSLERGDTGRILDVIREAFLTWVYDPKDGMRAFRRDELEHQRNR